MSKVSTARSPYSGSAVPSSTDEPAGVSRYPGVSLCSWGELVWDVFPDGPRLGGSAANLARHAQALGARAVLVSAVGDDAAGEAALAELARLGLATELVTRVPGAQTGRVRIDLDGAEPRYHLLVQGPPIAPAAALGAPLARCDVFCFSLLEQRRSSDRAALTAASERLPAHAIRLCDLNLRPPFVTRAEIERMLALASIVKLNEPEAQALAELVGAKDPLAFLLEQPTIELVAFTRGARGALLATRTERVEQPGLLLDAGTDSVGAGDAFNAALALERHAGSSLGQILERANRYAADALGRTALRP
jgi:fructokinase